MPAAHPSTIDFRLEFKSRARNGELGMKYRGLKLPYRLDPVAGRQPRLKGREALVPEVSLRDYRVMAVVDYVGIRFQTRDIQRAVNAFRMVRSQGVPCRFVTGPNDEDEHLGTDFICKIYDPSPKHLLEHAAAINKHPGLSCEGDLALVEISIDWYSRSGSVEERLRMTELLRRHILPARRLWTSKNGWPRWAEESRERKRKASADHIFGKDLGGPDDRVCAIYAGQPVELDPLHAHARSSANHRQPTVDGTTYFGSRDGAAMLRVMDKTRDQQDRKSGTFIRLDETTSRSRVEVQLRPEIFGSIKRCADLRDYKFEGLRKEFFEFVQPTVPAPSSSHQHFERLLHDYWRGQELQVFKLSGAIGLHWFQQARLQQAEEFRRMRPSLGLAPRKKEPYGLRKSGFSRAYAELNKQADEALRGLTRRWSA